MAVDKSNYIKILEDFPKQCREALELPRGIVIKEEISNIVVCGMGGSAIGGDLLKTYLSDTEIPVVVNRNYNLPKFVNEYSLVFAISYSGNTEETLGAYKEAVNKKAKIWALTSGGELANQCEKVIKIPTGLQPRAAIGYLFFPILGLLHNSGITNVKNSDLNEMLAILKNTEDFKEKGEELSKKIKDKIPVIYSSSLFEPVAYRMKTQFNENSKHPAFYHVFPEMNHNELVGFKDMERKNFIVLMIRDEFDHPRTKKRMDICKEIMEKRVDVEEIHTKGNSLLARLFSTIYLGDFASYYLAMHNRVDPAPVEVIEWLKGELNK